MAGLGHKNYPWRSSYKMSCLSVSLGNISLFPEKRKASKRKRFLAENMLKKGPAIAGPWYFKDYNSLKLTSFREYSILLIDENPAKYRHLLPILA
jgi:hypothetical protein